MGLAVGGDIIEVTFNHPTLGYGIFTPKAGEDSTYDLGGFRNDDDANGIDGQGNMIMKKNRVRPSFEVVCAWDANIKGDLEVAVALAESNVQAEWTFTSSNKTVYKMKGVIVGDVQGNGNAATFTFKVAGSGVMKKISG